MSAKHLGIVAGRQSGDSYEELAAKFHISATNCRRTVLIAKTQGIEAVAKMKDHANAGKPVRKLPDDVYNALWLDRIRRRTIIDANGCHLWQGCLTLKGYGQTTYRGRGIMVHRQVYKLVHKTELAEEEFICHSCDVKNCWNPDHTWLGDNGLNKKDETSKGTNFWAKKTHCPLGHAYTPENVFLHESKPGVMSRNCKTCMRGRMRTPAYRAKAAERQRRYRAERRARVAL